MIKARRMRWAGYVARKVKTKNSFRIFIRKPEGSTPLLNPRCRRGNNIKINVRQDVEV
jgi:hypothetical protein